MSKYIGKLVNVSYGVESTRGTAVAASYWQPKMTLTVQDKSESVMDENSRGHIVDAITSDIVKKWAEGAIEGRAYVNALGYLLYSLLGSVNTAASGGAYVHTFSLLGTSNQHKSLTIGVKDPDLQLRHALCMIESLTLSIDNAGELTFSASFKGKLGTTTTHTVSYSTDYGLLGKHGAIKLATDLSGLGAASALAIKSLELTISKNLEMDYVVGSVEPADIYNTLFTIEGNIEAILDSTATYKDVSFGDTPKALRITVEDTATTIGSSENPKLNIDLARVKLIDWSPNWSNNEVVKQTIKFKGFYSMSDAEAIEAELTNTTSSY